MQVVNKKNHKPTAQDVYVGRNPEHYGYGFEKTRPALSERADGGNHFVVGEHGARGECVVLYKKWLWAKMQAGDRHVLAALRLIPQDANLVCWCAPNPCHADVIKAAAEWLRAKDLAGDRQ